MEWVVNATLPPLYSWERYPVLTVQEAASAPKTLWLGAENVASTKNRPPDHPSRSDSQYRLRYFGPLSDREGVYSSPSAAEVKNAWSLVCGVSGVVRRNNHIMVYL